MRLLFSYMGSKRRSIDDINRLLPDADCYAEPFAGSSVVFLNLTKEYSMYGINDINPVLVDFIKQIPYFEAQEFIDWGKHCNDKWGFMHGSDEERKKKYYDFRNEWNKKYFSSMKNNKNLKATFEFILLANMCINHMVRFSPNGFNQSWGDRFPSDKKLKTIGETIKYLQTIEDRIRVTSEDDFSILPQFNDSGYFLFLDPPYSLTDSSYKLIDYDKFYSALRGMKCKIMLTDVLKYTDGKINKGLQGLIDEGWLKQDIDSIKNISPNRGETEVGYNEVILMNYKVDKPKQNMFF